MLCLKFDKDWDLAEDEDEVDDEVVRKGFMVSGSSDCSIFVWDLFAYREGNKEAQVTAEVNSVLNGHTGGVLDLRIDSKWIVSW